MSTTTYPTFQVKVRIRGTPFEYYSKYGRWISHEVIEMFHFQRRTQKQAEQEASRYGEVISCCKVNANEGLQSIEKLELNPAPVYEAGNPYKSAVAMESMIWNKRNRRRENLYKDKEDA